MHQASTQTPAILKNSGCSCPSHGDSGKCGPGRRIRSTFSGSKCRHSRFSVICFDNDLHCSGPHPRVFCESSCLRAIFDTGFLTGMGFAAKIVLPQPGKHLSSRNRDTAAVSDTGQSLRSQGLFFFLEFLVLSLVF